MKSLKILFIILIGSNLCLTSCISVKSQEQSVAEFKYTYSMNLNEYKNDQLKIELQVHDLKEDTLQFSFPKIMPGIYSFVNYGSAVKNIEFKDSAGKSLKFDVVDENRWNIYDATQLRTITYSIDDGWEQFRAKSGVRKYFMTESMFQDDLFIINSNSIFGYFKGYENSPYSISIKHPKKLYAATGLSSERKDSVDIFQAKSYHELIDSPIMYAVPDTTSFSLPQIDVQVAGYTTDGKKNSKELAEYIKPLIENQTKYLGGKLPVKKYCFLIYEDNKNDKSYSGQGLEHKNSTLVLLHVPMNLLKDQVYGIASHEFFHTLMPIGIHSEKIANYDFQNPKFSKHLWLYEGMTEYFTIHMPIKNKLMSLQEFLGVIDKKYRGMQKFDKDLSLVDLALNSMKYDSQYTNVYQKGPLLNLCLDIKLRELSHGKYGVQNLVFDLLDRYGPDKAFKDNDLFDIIIQITGYPELRSFFKNYVEDSQELPLEKSLQKVGISFKNGKATLMANPTKAQLKLRRAWIDQ